MKTRAQSLTVAVALAAASAVALADRVDLAVYENAGNAPLAGIDLWVDVNDGPGSTIDFTFHNDSTVPAVITAIYFENAPEFSGLVAGTLFAQTSGVAFAPGATPPNPAQPGFLFGGPWAGNLYATRAIAPSPQWGINAGGTESLTVRFNASGINAAGIVAALTANPREFRIAQHVQGLADGFSVWSTNVPSPAGAALLGLAGVLAGRRRR